MVGIAGIYVHEMRVVGRILELIDRSRDKLGKSAGNMGQRSERPGGGHHNHHPPGRSQMTASVLGGGVWSKAC